MLDINIMKNFHYMKVMEQQNISGLPIRQNITLEQIIPLMSQQRNLL